MAQPQTRQAKPKTQQLSLCSCSPLCDKQWYQHKPCSGPVPHPCALFAQGWATHRRPTLRHTFACSTIGPGGLIEDLEVICERTSHCSAAGHIEHEHA